MASTSAYQAVDAVVSSNFSIYSASVSRVRDPLQPGINDSDSRPSNHGPSPRPPSERDALLGVAKSASKPFYRPRPLWIVPFAVVASVVRGMTLAPRVQVYTQLSCNAIYGHDVFNHTLVEPPLPGSSAARPLLPTHDPRPRWALHPSAYVPESAAASSVMVTFDQDNDDEPDPRSPPSERCLKDPAVTARAAGLQTIMTTVMGLLSAVTTGWWGGYGETHGRTRVLAVSTFGLFMTDLVFILVSTPHSIFAAHGHKLLIISPIIEGLCGGWATLQAATSAYISDCTSDGSRAHIFSRFTGVFYLGFAIGPAIGAFLIRHPFIPIFSPTIGVHNGAPTVTSVFYVAATASLINFILALFLFPESLSKKKAKVAAAEATNASITRRSNALVQDAPAQSAIARFLSPFALFLPKTVTGPNGTQYKDWNMTFLALVLFAHLLSLGLFQIKYLYAGHVYGWGAEQLSYYISTMGFSRALHLLFVLPLFISSFKPKPKPKPATTAAPAAAKPKPSEVAREMRFDMSLIRGSLIIDLCAHMFVALVSPTAGPADGQALFVAATALSSFGAGLVPAVNSLALCIMQARGQSDTGKMFGAFSIIQAVGQMILGPIIFGVAYSKTVASFPKAIFVMAAAMVFTAAAFTLLLRPDATLRPGPRRSPAALEAHRGRSRKSKDIRQPSFGSAASAAFSGEGEGEGEGEGSGAEAVGSYGAVSESLGSALVVGSVPVSGPSSAR